MFATEADTFSKVYEMAVDSIDNRPLVSENTRIVPEYIPPGMTFVDNKSQQLPRHLWGWDRHLIHL